MYDPEAMFQDADIEMAEMRQVGARMDAALRRGDCPHTSWVTYTPQLYYPEQERLTPGQVRCRKCKTAFDSQDDLLEATAAVLDG